MSVAFRLWVRLRREHLDRLLAEGASLSTRPLRERAEELTSTSARCAMADAADAMREAETEASRAARDELTALAIWERVWDTTDVLDDHAR